MALEFNKTPIPNLMDGINKVSEQASQLQANVQNTVDSIGDAFEEQMANLGDALDDVSLNIKGAVDSALQGKNITYHDDGTYTYTYTDEDGTYHEDLCNDYTVLEEKTTSSSETTTATYNEDGSLKEKRTTSWYVIENDKLGDIKYYSTEPEGEDGTKQEWITTYETDENGNTIKITDKYRDDQSVKHTVEVEYEDGSSFENTDGCITINDTDGTTYEIDDNGEFSIKYSDGSYVSYSEVYNAQTSSGTGEYALNTLGAGYTVNYNATTFTTPPKTINRTGDLSKIKFDSNGNVTSVMSGGYEASDITSINNPDGSSFSLSDTINSIQTVVDNYINNHGLNDYK